MKAGFDFIFALVLVLLTLPVVALSALVILAVDRQNPFFTQARLGKNKRVFTILKLRTMKNNQVTGIGKVFRRTGLDELPQLWNILLLQMSFVGPRPLTPADVDRLAWNDAYHAKRWNCRPGLTGLAQLSPVCHKKMSWFLDRYYVAQNHLLLDLKIIFASAAVLWVGKHRAIQWIYSTRRNERTR